MPKPAFQRVETAHVALGVGAVDSFPSHQRVVICKRRLCTAAIFRTP